MSSDNPTPPPDDNYDWRKAEADLGPQAQAGAEVLDLTAARTRKSGGDTDLGERHYEIALDDETEPGTVPVDLPPVDRTGRRPVIPSQWSTWPNIKSSLRYARDITVYRVQFHGVRSPWYAVQALFWATVGAVKVLGAQVRWWWVSEQYSLRQAAADRGDDQAWYKLHREVKATRAWRGFVIACEVILAVFGGPLLWTLAPLWVLVFGLGASVAMLAHHGRPADRRIVSPAVVTTRFRRINSDIVLRAYYSAGLGHPDKPDQQIAFGSSMARDAASTGSQVTIDLPYGKGWDDVVAKKGAIASGLDVSVNQVFLSKDPSSHRRHVLFVADRDPLALPAGRTPLLDGKPRDIWTEAPFGLDERGRKVTLLLMWISVLVGAQPRKGKTFATRLLALFAALDPYVTVLVADGKMSADWDKFRLIAHRFVCGVVPNSRDSDPVRHMLEMLREVKQHIEAVNDFLASLPTAECPEGKLTRELSRKYPLLRPWLLVMEEFQVYYETDDQQVNKEIAELLSFILAVGPSSGVILLSSSQKPASVGAGDVARLFNRFRDNHAVRFALKCGNWRVSEAILGGDSLAEGYDASSLPNGKLYRGVGILYGHSDDTATVRTYLADHADAEKILTAARVHRENAGTLSGDAVGEQAARNVRDVLADVRSIFLAEEPGLHWKTIAARLAEQMPEHYADINDETISAQMRAVGVRSVGVKVRGTNLNGCRVSEIDTAIAKRRSA